MSQRKHLSRLTHVWIERPIFYITTCTRTRICLLDQETVAPILIDEWRMAHSRHGWAVGRYVVMPDHVHFFCRADQAAKSLSDFMQRWKEWTSKRIARECGVEGMEWQAEFFDHVLRSYKSYVEKWFYVWQNPVRAGLVQNPEDWPWQGELGDLTL